LPPFDRSPEAIGLGPGLNDVRTVRDRRRSYCAITIS